VIPALQAPGVTLTSQGLIALRGILLHADPAPALANLPGGFATKAKGHGLEGADIRPYVPGDDVRHLDRNATARTGVLHVRQFHQERDRITLLIADFRPSMFWGVRRAFLSVAAAEALALVGWNVVQDGGRVGLLTLGAGAPVVVVPRGRVRGMLDVIGGLVQAHQAGLAAVMAGQVQNPPLDSAFPGAQRMVPAGAEVVLASGFDGLGAGFADGLNALALRRSPRLVLITDAAALPPGHYPVRLADGRRLRISLNGGAQAAAPQDIAGRTPLVIDAGSSLDDTARRIKAAFAPLRAA
jgi:uncharacterized protein (DUF58 family)